MLIFFFLNFSSFLFLIAVFLGGCERNVIKFWMKFFFVDIILLRLLPTAKVGVSFFFFFDFVVVVVECLLLLFVCF